MKSSWRFFLSLGTAVALLGSLPAAALPLPQASPDSTKLRTDENVARQSFEDIWTPANRALPFSKGTVVSSCTPGEANPEAVKQMLAVWNYIRALNGLSQLEIPPEYEPSTFAQAAALTAAASPQASSNPAQVPGAQCINEASTLASRAGVISRLDGIVTPATEVLRYLTEASPQNWNDNLGHRLEMLSPSQARTAIGAVSIGTAGPSATSIQLFDSTYRAAGKTPSPSLWDSTLYAPQQFTWPAAGYFPTRMLPTGAKESISRWSFSARCADLRQATVKVFKDGTQLPLEVIRREEAGKDPNLTPWNYAGYDTVLFKLAVADLEIPQYYDTVSYEVQVTGIQAAPGCQGVADSTSYQVKLFNPTWPADPEGDADNDGIPNWRDSRPRIPDLTTDRWAGDTRVTTSIAIARQFQPAQTKTVYLARSDLLADALVGGVLKDGPVILLPRENQPLPASIAAQIKRLDPQSVVALGGAQAVSNQRLYQLAAGRQAARLGGKTREETSLIIARQAFKTADSLYLAQAASDTGGASPDALTAASLRDGPIVLINPASPTIATTRQLAADLQVKRVVALGGNNVIPTEPLSIVAGNLAATRLGGSDRYETSRQIAREAFRLHPDTHRAYLARGDIFADAVAGGKLADGPILLLPPKCQPLGTETLRTLGAINAFRIIALGGTGAVCEANLRDSLRWPELMDENVTDF